MFYIYFSQPRIKYSNNPVMSKLQQHTATTKPETRNTSNLKQTHNKQHVTRNLKPVTRETRNLHTTNQKPTTHIPDPAIPPLATN